MGIRRKKATVSAATTPAANPAATPAAHGPFTYDSVAGAEALAALRPALAAIAPEDVDTARLDVEAAAYAALSIAKLVQSDDVRPRFAELPARAFEMANADGLAPAALAALAALEAAQDEGAQDTEAKVPPALAAEAAEIEQRMQTVCEYHLSDDPEIAPLLDRLRPGTGYRDLLNDLKGYARIYERRADVVKTDTKNYRPGDLKRARELAAILGQAFFDTMSPRAREAYDTCARCWTVLSARYEEVRQTGLWLFRADPHRDQLFPSLYVAGRPGVGRPRRSQGAAPPEAPAPAPAADAAAPAAPAGE